MTSHLVQWNSAQLPDTRGYAHVSESTGDGHVHLSGLASRQRRGATVQDEDLELQTRDVLRKVFLVLAEAGLTPSDVVRRTTYVVGLTPEKASTVLDVYSEIFAPHSTPAASMVGVTALAHPDMLIEIECTAVRPPSEVPPADRRTRPAVVARPLGGA
jgi:enamine deaminase RidA (YjgF/YER057c/UK114 family)